MIIEEPKVMVGISIRCSLLKTKEILFKGGIWIMEYSSLRSTVVQNEAVSELKNAVLCYFSYKSYSNSNIDIPKGVIHFIGSSELAVVHS